MTSSISSARQLGTSRGRAAPQQSSAIGWQIARLRDLFRRRRPEPRMAPPLPNAHYIAVHMAAASYRATLR